uniref:GH151 n=1 Tax=uncultured Armatimonadetes bacterium TaxID=157466 RepID=A0A6J4JFJ3_9BACT|nr:GH151 [uncultured Armatimonadetes bacterium]
MQTFRNAAAVGTLAAALLLAGAAGAAPAQKPTRDLWGKPIMKQPFDTEPFRPIQIPDWLQGTTRLLYDIGMTSAHAEARAAGVQMGEIGFSNARYATYPSKLLEMDPSLPRDHTDKQIAAFKKHGIRIIAAVMPSQHARLYAQHPDWRAIRTNTTTIPQVDVKTNPEGGELCQMGPWGDHVIEVLAEILTMYPEVDGFSFDGIHHGPAEYCQYCRAAYRKEAGAEIPDVNMEDPAFRRYQLWVDRRMERYIERMQKRIKGIKPGAVLVTHTTNAGRFGHLRDIPRGMSTRMNLLFDAPSQEFWMDEQNRGNTVVPAFANAYIWAVSNHRIAFSNPYLMSHGNPYSNDSFPGHEDLRRILLIMTYGIRPNHALGWRGHKENVLRDVKEITRRARWITHLQSEPWAAMVMSEQTRNAYGRHPMQVEDRYLANVLGVFRTALEEHLPMTVINDWNLNAADLARYKVLVLPNTACMNDEQARAVEQYVRNGGGLVATVDTSLYDEAGNPRDDFALADLFGVHYKGILTTGGDAAAKEKLDVEFLKGLDANYWEKRKNIFDFTREKHALFDHPRLREYLGEWPAIFKGQAIAVGSPSPDVKTIGTITPRQANSQNVPAQANSQNIPAVVVRSYGKGKVVYMPAGFDSAYYLYPYPYQRILMAQAMRWVAPEAPPITVKAPMSVHSTFFRQKSDGGERLVVHLYNDLNSSANHAKPDDDVPLREEVVPIHDITLTFDGYNVSRVHLQPEGVELKAKKSGGKTEVTVPKLEIHSMVVVELAR